MNTFRMFSRVLVVAAVVFAGNVSAMGMGYIKVIAEEVAENEKVQGAVLLGATVAGTHYVLKGGQWVAEEIYKGNEDVQNSTAAFATGAAVLAKTGNPYAAAAATGTVMIGGKASQPLASLAKDALGDKLTSRPAQVLGLIGLGLLAGYACNTYGPEFKSSYKGN